MFSYFVVDDFAGETMSPSVVGLPRCFIFVVYIFVFFVIMLMVLIFSLPVKYYLWSCYIFLCATCLGHIVELLVLIIVCL